MTVSMNTSHIRQNDRERAAIAEAMARYERGITEVAPTERNPKSHTVLHLPGSRTEGKK